MQKLSKYLVLASFVIGGFAPAYANDIEKAVLDGKPLLDVRLRYENVDQGGFSNDANALTVRTRFGYETADFHGLKVLVEAENVSSVSDEDYNDTTNGQTAFPVVADPETTELNRLHVTYDGVPKTVIRLGRQRIILDNARFVGNVGFRQNEQTFDAVLVQNTSIEHLTATYAFINQINRIFGNNSAVGRLDSHSHAMNATYDGINALKVTGYIYLLDVDDVPTLSSATYGGRATFSHEIANGVKGSLTLEYASQEDHEDNPASFSHDYYLIEGSASHHGASIIVGYEVLDGDGMTAFQTPLATGHKFQGWADVFLTTPATGIEDIYVGGKYVMKDLGLIKKLVGKIVYHNFQAEVGGADYGDEIDAVLHADFEHGIYLEAKYANYFADGFATDREKIWLALGLKL
jgi:hypothetical protein